MYIPFIANQVQWCVKHNTLYAPTVACTTNNPSSANVTFYAVHFVTYTSMQQFNAQFVIL